MCTLNVKYIIHVYYETLVWALLHWMDIQQKIEEIQTELLEAAISISVHPYVLLEVKWDI